MHKPNAMPMLQWWWARKDLRLWALRQQQRFTDLKVGLMVCIKEGNEGQDITDNFVPSLSLPDSPPLSFLGLWPQVCGSPCGTIASPVYMLQALQHTSSCRWPPRACKAWYAAASAVSIPSALRGLQPAEPR